MTDNVNKVGIFIASSKELKKEREKCIQTIFHLNKSHAHLSLTPILWEYDLYHASYPGKVLQEEINPKLENSNLAIFLFYSKLGPFTHQEFDLAIKNNKTVFMFFKTGFIPTDEDQKSSYSILTAFKQEISDCIEYSDLSSFQFELYSNLNLFLMEQFGRDKLGSSDPDAKNISQSVLELIRMVNEKDRLLNQKEDQIRKSEEANLKEQIALLKKEKENLKQQLQSSKEIIQQQERQKEQLLEQLYFSGELNNIRKSAIQYVKGGNYKQAEELLFRAINESQRHTAQDFYEIAELKTLQLEYSSALRFYELAAKIDDSNSWYLYKAGEMANLLGYYDKAIKYLISAADLLSDYIGKNRMEIADIYNSLGIAFKQKGLYDNALEYYENALNIYARLALEESAETASVLGNIGLIHDTRGEYDKAIDYHNKALGIDLNVFGINHRKIAKRYHNLALAYEGKNKLIEAVEYYEKAIEIDARQMEPEDLNIAATYNSLGLTYWKLGQYERAKEEIEKALTIYKKIIDVHPHIASCYNNLGLICNKKGEHEKAIDYYNKALALDKKFYGEEHPEIGIRYNNLGREYCALKEFDKSMEYYCRALKIFKNFFSQEHPYVEVLFKNISEVTMKARLQRQDLKKCFEYDWFDN